MTDTTPIPLKATEVKTWIAAHPDAALYDRPAIVLGEAEAGRWRNGNSVSADVPAGVIRVYDVLGNWLGVGSGYVEARLVKPEKVVTEAN